MLQRCVASFLRPASASTSLLASSLMGARSAASSAAVEPQQGADAGADAAAASGDRPGPPSILVKAPVQALFGRHVGSFYKLQPGLLQEDEAAATRSQALMYRESTHALRGALSRAGSRLLVRGPTGSGKSLALVSLVEWARASGWIVMYVPSATALTRGGYFIPRQDTGQYDTIVSAQQILRSMVQAHGKQLAAMPKITPKGAEASTGTLLDLVNEGLATDSNAALAVDACLALKDALVAASRAGGAPRVLFAIDDYNALHWRTRYGRAGEDGKRLPVKVEDLTLASNMRLLAPEDTGRANVIAAVSSSNGIPEGNELTCASDVHTFHMPRYSLVEAAHALYWYWECGLAPSAPTEEHVKVMHALTNGNAKEIRMLTPKMTLLCSKMM